VLKFSPKSNLDPNVTRIGDANLAGEAQLWPGVDN